MCRTLFLFFLFYYRVILTLSTSVYVRSGERWGMHAGTWVSEWVCVCVCACTRAFLAVIELLFGSVLKVGFYIMKWNVIYKLCVCVCVFVPACVRVCWTFILPILVLDIGLYFTSEHYSYLWHVCVCVCMRVCVRVYSCRCEYVRLGVVLLVQMGC